MEFKKQIVGTKDFGPEIDITDPCYDKDVWCRLRKAVKQGKYSCIAWIDPEENRVAITGIYYNGRVPDYKDFEMVGEIGVDAGLAGFFNDKPDYDNAQWQEICHMLDIPDKKGVRKNAWITEDGFFTESGWGDGCYPVYACTKNGEVVAMEINFYGEYKDE